VARSNWPESPNGRWTSVPSSPWATPGPGLPSEDAATASCTPRRTVARPPSRSLLTRLHRRASPVPNHPLRTCRSPYPERTRPRASPELATRSAGFGRDLGVGVFVHGQSLLKRVDRVGDAVGCLCGECLSPPSSSLIRRCWVPHWILTRRGHSYLVMGGRRRRPSMFWTTFWATTPANVGQNKAFLARQPTGQHHVTPSVFTPIDVEGHVSRTVERLDREGSTLQTG